MGGYGDLGAAGPAAGIIATRWALLVVWTVLIGCGAFTEFSRGLPRISPTALTDRLRMRKPLPAGGGAAAADERQDSWA